MTTNNPDPLEVWKAANRAYGQKETAHDYNNPDTRAARIRLANEAAAAILSFYPHPAYQARPNRARSTACDYSPCKSLGRRG